MSAALLNTPCPRTSSAPAHQPVLGRYRLGQKLASGGMATVYLAVATDSPYVARPLALKCIHPHLASSPGFLEMFIDEARIASRLNHPNLCGVLDFGEANGSYFMTMEYLTGEPLNRLTAMLTQQREHLDRPQLARIAAQIVSDACEGLHSAHELRDDDGQPLRVVHRDVTPSNLFVTYEGVTRVVDFGVASAANCLHHTSTGTIKGKFGYMSPDQFTGERPDRGADLWALGVVLWEAIALRPLFRRENPALTMAATLDGTVPLLHEVVPGISPFLTRVVERALSRDKVCRYATARDMALDLQQYLAAHGAPNARSEVAALLAEVFPKGEAEKRRLVKSVVEGRCIAASSHAGLSLVEPVSAVAPKARRLMRTLRLRARKSMRLLWGVATFSVMLVLLQLASEAKPHTPTLESRPLIVTPQPAPAAVAKPPVTSPPREEPRTAPVTTSIANENGAEPSALSTETNVEQPSAQEALASSREERDAPTVSELRATKRRREARAAARAAATPLREGTVSISTSGDWAEVYHGGQRIGATPMRFALLEGRQVLSLRPGNGAPARDVVVTVSAGETTRLRIDL